MLITIFCKFYFVGEAKRTANGLSMIKLQSQFRGGAQVLKSSNQTQHVPAGGSRNYREDKISCFCERFCSFPT